MTKRLVMCCDGTWNTPDQATGDLPNATNVAKVAMALAPRDEDGREQRLYYHRGVGTNRSDRILGGAFGAGLFRDVCDTYRFVVQNYEPGDELFFFGFSRGAFTARSTVGLIRNCGVLRRENVDQIDQAYALYRDPAPNARPRSAESALFRKMYSHEPGIRFIGVWDTVGALGIPEFGGLLAKRFNRRYAFHNTELSSKVEEAYQAIAIDERRGPFVPAVWSRKGSIPPEQRLEQMWFTGAHCDVGGGSPKRHLSDIALCWMVEKARGAHLAFVDEAFRPASQVGPMPNPIPPEKLVEAYTCIDPDPNGEPDKTRKGIYRLLDPCNRKGGKAENGNEYIASTADRYEHRPGWWVGAPPDNDAEHRVKQVDLAGVGGAERPMASYHTAFR